MLQNSFLAPEEQVSLNIRLALEYMNLGKLGAARKMLFEAMALTPKTQRVDDELVKALINLS